MADIYLGQQKLQSGRQSNYEQPFLASVAGEQILDELVEALHEPREQVEHLLSRAGLPESDLPSHLRSLGRSLTPAAIAEARDHVSATLSLSEIRLSCTIRVSPGERSGDNGAGPEITLDTYRLLGLESARTQIDLTPIFGVGVRCDLIVFCLPGAGHYLYPVARPEEEAGEAFREKAQEIEQGYGSNAERNGDLRPRREPAPAPRAGRETEVITRQLQPAPDRPPASMPVRRRHCRGRLFEFPWAADLTVNFSIFNVNRLLSLYTAECLFVSEC